MNNPNNTPSEKGGVGGVGGEGVGGGERERAAPTTQKFILEHFFRSLNCFVDDTRYCPEDEVHEGEADNVPGLTTVSSDRLIDVAIVVAAEEAGGRIVEWLVSRGL